MPEHKPISNQELLVRLDERVQNLTSDVKEVKDTLNLQLAETKAQVMVIQAFIARSNLEKKVDEWDEMATWVRDFKKTYLIVTGFIGLVGTIIGYFMNNILTWIQSR